MEGLCVPRLPRNAVQMIVAEVQNPSTMWLIDIVNEKISKEYFDLEERLKNFIETRKPDYYSSVVNIGDIVAVYDTVSGSWCRAKVFDIYQRLGKYFYCTFLLDRGISINVESCQIKELPQEMHKLQFRCYHVQLYGILPLNFEEGQILDYCKETPSYYWDQATLQEVKHMIATSSAVYFVPSFARKIVYGKIYLKFEGGFINLGKHICSRNLAKYDSALFKYMTESAPYICSRQDLNVAPADDVKKNFMVNIFDDDTNISAEVIKESHLEKNIAGAPSESHVTDSVSKDKRKYSSLQLYYEKMRNNDKSNCPPLISEAKVSESISKVISCDNNQRGIGRGELHKILLNACRTPGMRKTEVESSCEDYRKDTLHQEVNRLSLSTNNVKCSKDSNDNTKTLGSSDLDSDHSNMPGACSAIISRSSSIEKKWNVHAWPSRMAPQTDSFCTSKTNPVLLPAGAERSMLIAKKRSKVIG